MITMALIKCPECGKEISDQADRCPNCGYKKPRTRKINFQKKHIAIFGGCFAVVVVMIATCFILMKSKDRSPFEKISANMKKEQVHKEFGKPQAMSSNEDDYIVEESYYHVSFLGLDGMLLVNYSEEDHDGSITDVDWKYISENEEDISDFSEKVEQIKEFFTEKYGSPREASDRSDILTWEDSVGQSYTLHIGLDADNKIPKSIRISFEP